METMAESRIDDVILSAVRERWVKVAMVIAKVTAAISEGEDFSSHENYEIVFRHIQALVHSGKLVAQGNIQKWRFSEIRQPGGR